MKGPFLLPQHQALINASAISAEAALARRYRTVTSRAELGRLGFGDSQRRVPALLIPVWGVIGEIVTYQARPDEPRILGGKAIKYETPKGSKMALDVPPGALLWLADPKRPLFITEGARKADAGVSAGLCTIALLGVWNWRGRSDQGGSTVLADWESIALKGRDTFIVFDSDVVTKKAVSSALRRLKAFLESRGAKVKVIYLPCAESGSKVGLDDFLSSGNSTGELLALASDLKAFPEGDDDRDVPYEETSNGIVWNKPVQGATVPVLLTNFKARITAELIEDDGVETRRNLEIRAELDGSALTLRVPASAFPSMNWPLVELGPRAIVSPGMGTRDHARAAIQFLSTGIERKVLYRHTGWREIEGKYVYLHSGGAIGPEGPVDGIQVQLPAPLERFELPAPSVGDALGGDARAVLLVLEVAPARIAFVLFAAVWRAAMGTADFGLHLVGATGVYKSEFAALLQRFFGPLMDARSLPGSWSSTDNALEALAFFAKNTLLTIDDFAPAGSKADIQSYHRKADRLFRAQGNNSGRSRLSSECSLVTGRAPRGLILSTGEDIPTGQSIRARALIVEMTMGDVDLRKLTQCQEAAANGAFARVMSAFLCWVCGRREQLVKRLSDRALELRSSVGSSPHARTPSIAAELQAGFEVWIEFAAEKGLVPTGEDEALRERCWNALGECARAQSQHLTAAEPTSLFLRLLQAAVSSGRAHVAEMDGNAPSCELAGALGWRRKSPRTANDQFSDWYSNGERVGWIDGDHLYLDPETAHKAAQEMGSETERLSIGVRTLIKRLAERGVLRSQEGDRDKHTVRRQVQGARRGVLHMDASMLGIGALRAQGAQDPGWPDPGEGSGPEAWAGKGELRSTSGPQNGPTEAAARGTDAPSGPIGPDGPETAEAEGAAPCKDDDTAREREAIRQHGLFSGAETVGHGEPGGSHSRDPEASCSVGPQ